jgi:hypothetical protein
MNFLPNVYSVRSEWIRFSRSTTKICRLGGRIVEINELIGWPGQEWYFRYVYSRKGFGIWIRSSEKVGNCAGVQSLRRMGFGMNID